MQLPTKSLLLNTPLSLLFSLLITVQGCKSDEVDPNPQQDDSEVSNQFGLGTSTGTLDLPDLDEASGLANSRSNPDFYWSHNDSGGDPVLYLITPAGADSGRYQLDGVDNIDWEDMAVGPGPVDQIDYLYVADIGDNRAQRASLSIYRTPEPDVSIRFRTLGAGNQQRQIQLDLPADTTLGNIETIEFIYEDGPRDAETLMVDPNTKDLFIVTKREPSVILYTLPFPQNTTELDTAERVRVLSHTFTTAGDISPDGNEVLIKNYQNIYYWKKSANESIEELLAQPPLRLNYTPEPQGEAIAWKNDQSGFFTISEINNAENVQILEYRRN